MVLTSSLPSRTVPFMNSSNWRRHMKSVRLCLRDDNAERVAVVPLIWLQRRQYSSSFHAIHCHGGTFWKPRLVKSSVSWVSGPTTQCLHREVYQGISQQMCLTELHLISYILWSQDLSLIPSDCRFLRYISIPALFLSDSSLWWLPEIHSCRNLWGLSSGDQTFLGPELTLPLEIWVLRTSVPQWRIEMLECHSLEVMVWGRNLSSHGDQLLITFVSEEYWNIGFSTFPSPPPSNEVQKFY